MKSYFSVKAIFFCFLSYIFSCTLPTFATNISDVYEAAKHSDPVLKGAEANYFARKEAMPQARSALLPSVSISGQKSDIKRKFPNATISDPTSPFFGQALPSQNFDDTVWQAEATQSLFDLESWFTYRSAKATVKQADADYSAAEQNLIIRVVEAYLDVLRAQDRLDSNLAEEAAVKRQLEQVQQRFDVGLVAITDVLESTAAYDNASVRRIQSDGDHDIFFETLRTLSGVAYHSLDRLSEALPIVNPAPQDEEAWTTMALDTNLSILAAKQQLKSSKQLLKARRSGHLPIVQGIVSHSEFETGGSSFLGSRTDTTTYAIRAKLPIFQGGFTHSRSKEAKFRVEAARQQLMENTVNVTRDTRNFFRAVSTDVLRVKARLRAIKSSESALEATETGYEVGTRNIVDVLQAQQRLYLSQFDYADSRYNYVLDLLRLKQATGALEKADLLKLNDFITPENPIRNKTLIP
ncbi:MAG: TolC family outer membrane protein [Pseudomonadales bacterium]|nr:TolC family outer membrane protein [Pseudomonadales bacterium]